MKLSFNFHDYPESCPSGYQVVGKLNDTIVAIADDKNERYGVLFHPEDVEYSQEILDNFIGLCHQGQDEQDKLMIGQFEGIKRFKDFNK
jgi:GMP synthase-like glutamine amidotransferase